MHEVLNLKCAYQEDKLWGCWKSSGLIPTELSGEELYLLCVRFFAKTFMFFISFNPHQYPGRSLIINSFTDLFIYRAANMGQDFVEVKWDGEA